MGGLLCQNLDPQNGRTPLSELHGKQVASVLAPQSRFTAEASLEEKGAANDSADCAAIMPGLGVASSSRQTMSHKLARPHC